MNEVMSSLGFGIVTASILLPAAVGFSLQFSTTNVFNIAFGAQMTLAAFIAYVCTQHGMNLWVAMVVAGLFGAAVSTLLNRLLLSPFIRRGMNFFGMIVITIALALIVEYVVEVVWGPGTVNYPLQSGSAVHVGSMIFSRDQVVIIFVGAAIAVAMHSLLKYTRVGKAMRAVANNKELAQSCGIRAQRVTDFAWAVSGLMGGLAGVMLGISVSALSYTMGDTFLMEFIAAAILGGIGQVYGAMVGALVIGVLLEESALVLTGAYAPIAAFVVLILVLLVRPTGIFAGAAKVKGIA